MKVIFQFHKGTIKTKKSIAEAFSASDFNSIKVRLKPIGHLFTYNAVLFQFHKGTIKTSVSALSLLSAVISIP